MKMKNEQNSKKNYHIIKNNMIYNKKLRKMNKKYKLNKKKLNNNIK